MRSRETVGRWNPRDSGPFGRRFGEEGGIRDRSEGLLHLGTDGPPQLTQIRAKRAQQGSQGKDEVPEVALCTSHPPLGLHFPIC